MNERLARIRSDFPILHQPLRKGGKDIGLVYLDNAATTQKPRTVMDAITSYYTNSNANVHRGIHTLGERATSLFEEAREAVRKFIGAASTREVIFTRGTTESVNLVAATLPSLFQPGDEILLTEMEHHSNLVPWQMAAEKRGLILRFIPIHDNGTLDQDAYKNLLGPKTKLVAFTWMSNVLGTINPVKEMASLAHQAGAYVLVDGAQGVPHLQTNVEDLGADFLVFSSHKMCGPMGMGVLWGKETLLEQLPPWQGGGEMIRSVRWDGFDVNDLPYKFEAGTPNVEGAVGLTAALAYLQSIGMESIHHQEELLTTLTLQGLKGIPKVRLLGEAPMRGGIAAFEVKGIHAHDLASDLDRRGIAIRAGHHCAHPLARRMGVTSSARASYYFYNTEEEVKIFLTALEEIIRDS